MNIKPCKFPDHLTVKTKHRSFGDPSILLLSFVISAQKQQNSYCNDIVAEICYDLPRPSEAREARAQGGRLPKREAPTMMSPPSQGLLQF